jgi:type I restriction enzyme S subunit
MKAGWEIKRLGEVAKATYGYTEKASFEEIGPRFLRITDIQEVGVDWETVPFCKISDDDLAKYRLKDGDIVFARTGATTGKSYLVYDPPKAVFASYLIKVHINDKGLSPEYLFLFFQTKTYWDNINSGISGSAQGGFNATKLAELEIPIPPHPEQQRIVAILDEAFAAIAKAKANAEQNLKNAKELFESYLQGVFERRGEGWKEKTLGEIANVIGGYSFKSTEFLDHGKFQVIRMGNVRPGLIRANESPVFIDELEEKVRKRALLIPNDVIITQTGTKNKRDYGFTVIIEQDNYLLNQRISAIRFSNNYNSKFFLYYSWTNHFKDQFFANETGTVGQGNVGIGAITGALIPFPSLAIQHATVQKLDALSAETKRLEAIYRQKIASLDELKKTLLQKAFQGELKTERVVV